ncbi:TonB-dependent receptor domain-containing protein [Falsirhodobacter xinxiangensis]|uniref:TonB-dependent receptor domain-containing protein n=1 Tax=Falsirhodobacter xinxiangensis TaxID=2530049 RepID=UPI001FE894D5|nr:TonB-dependent receptor [Rhodobacter xinxiangensis]
MAACSRMRAALLGSAAFLFPIQSLAQDTLLAPIIVESKREVATDTAAPVTTIDQREIDDRQAGTIAELIDSVPGVTLMNGSTPSGSGINIRGFGANGTYGTDGMVLIQVDGATQGAEELYRLGTQLYTDPALYKEVEVGRGTVGSFEYGSGVIGGRVQLRTKDASDFTGGVPGWAGRQTLEFGSNGDGITSSSILAWQPTEDLEFLGQYVWRDQDRQDDGDGNWTGGEAFTLRSALLKGKYTFGAAKDQAVTLSWNDSDTPERDVPYDMMGLGAGSFGNVDRDVKMQTAILLYEWDPASALIDLEANLSRSRQKIDSTYILGSSPNDQGMALGDADHDTTTTKLTVKNTARFAAGGDHTLRTGFEVIDRDRVSASSAPGGTDKRFALFAVDDVEIGRWTISPSLRYETQKLETSEAAIGTFGTEFDNDALMGGISARYAFDNGVAVFASVAHTELLPILDDYTAAGLANGWMNQSQAARSWELGASYGGGDLFAAGDAFAIKGNLYRTDIRDMTTYSGIEQVEMKGLELEAAYSLESGFYTDLNLNITEGDQFVTAQGDWNYWSNAAADRLRLTVGQRFGDELDLSWEAVANARFDRVNPTTFMGVTTPGVETPGGVVHNIRASYTPQSGVLAGTELRLGVENLFDRDYRPRLATRDAAGRNIKFTIAKAF